MSDRDKVSFDKFPRFSEEFGEGFEVIFVVAKKFGCECFILLSIPPGGLLDVSIKLLFELGVKKGNPGFDLVFLVSFSGEHNFISFILIDFKICDLFRGDIFKVNFPLIMFCKESLLFPEEVVLVIEVEFFFFFDIFL
jgi:hypothetical protein